MTGKSIGSVGLGKIVACPCAHWPLLAELKPLDSSLHIQLPGGVLHKGEDWYTFVEWVCELIDL